MLATSRFPLGFGGDQGPFIEFDHQIVGITHINRDVSNDIASVCNAYLGWQSYLVDVDNANKAWYDIKCYYSLLKAVQCFSTSKRIGKRP